MRSFILTAAICALVACSPSGPALPVAPEIVAPAEPAALSPADFRARYAPAIAAAVADRSTPEAALRAWWAANDVLQSVGCESATAARELTDPWLAVDSEALAARNSATVTGEAEAYFAMSVERMRDPRCITRTFARVIQSNEQSGADKAIVVALVHNTTPVPTGVDVGEINSRRRELGNVYRYTLQRLDDGWRVASIEGGAPSGEWLAVTRLPTEPDGPAYSVTLP